MNEAFSLMLLPWGAVLRKEFVIVAMQRFVVVGARTLWEARRAGSFGGTRGHQTIRSSISLTLPWAGSTLCWSLSRVYTLPSKI
jgi:hypothetical protein